MRKSLAILLLVLLAFVTWSQSGMAARETVVVDITARQFEFSPAEIRVQQGEVVRINLSADDVTHGWYLEGYDLNLEDKPRDKQVDTVEFVADKAGRFTYHCSTTCGPMHPFMSGTLIVEPRSTLPAALGLNMIVGLGSLLYVTRRGRPSRPGDAPAAAGSGTSLTERWPWLKRLLRWRWFQYMTMVPGLLGFAVVLYAGFFGTSVGNANFAIIFVWVVWWALLILALIPFGGRLWCTVCPLPAPGEWLDRRAFGVKGRERPLLLAARGWPKRFHNIWAQNLSFLAVALFSGIILTRPLVTSAVLSAFIVLAIVFSLKYGKRIFCRYLCPVGGFIGLYSMMAPLELRVRDRDVCRRHKEKDCINGNARGYGCPWMEVPWNMERNAYCGLCTECLKTCPKENITVNLRPFGSDFLVQKHRSLDENYKAFIMLTCAVVYSIVFLGPWGMLKDGANLAMPGFLIYAASFLAANLIVTPGLFALAVWLGHGWARGKLDGAGFLLSPFTNLAAVFRLLIGKVASLSEPAAASESSADGLPPLRQLFTDLAYVLVPMGLAAWMAFSVSFLLVNGSYALRVASDPFGWGWNLLGTADTAWKPVLTNVLPFLQILILMGGLAFSISLGYKLVRQYPVAEDKVWRLVTPVVGLLIGITSVFLWLYV